MPLTQHLLLVDDDEPLRSILRRGLEREGYQVREAGDGGAALRLLASAPADLVITDLVMPEMEGIALILSLRESHPLMPVIAMSGGGRLEPLGYLEIARGCGATRLLAKPFGLAELIGLVQELIGPRELPQPPTPGPD